MQHKKITERDGIKEREADLSVSFPYAFVDVSGKPCLTHVDDIQDSDRPYCPECGGRMIARRGALIRHHFAHASLVDCASSGETLEHLLSKDILMSGGRIMLPDCYSDIMPDKVCWRGGVAKYSHPVLEEKQGDTYRPDAKITTCGERVAVEILVTHTPEAQKVRAFNYMRVPMLEIDCNGIALMPKDDVAKYVLEDAPRRWLSYMEQQKPYIKSADDRMLRAAKESIENSERLIEEADVLSKQRQDVWRTRRLRDLSSRANIVYGAYMCDDASKPAAIMSTAERNSIPNVRSRHSIFSCQFAHACGIIRYAKRNGQSCDEVFRLLSGRGLIDPVFHNNEAAIIIRKVRKIDVTPIKVVRYLFDAL